MRRGFTVVDDDGAPRMASLFVAVSPCGAYLPDEVVYCTECVVC